MSSIRELLQHQLESWHERRERRKEVRLALDQMHVDCIQFVRQYGESAMQNGLQHFYLTLPGESLRIDVTELDPEGIREMANRDERLWYEHLNIEYDAEGGNVLSTVDPYNELIHRFIKYEGGILTHFYEGGTEFSQPNVNEITNEYRNFMDQTLIPSLTAYAEKVNQSQQ